MWRTLLGLLLGLAACGGAETQPAAPSQQNDEPTSRQEVHDALVVIHKAAVEACFGGFGKGAPYAVSMKIGNGKIVSAEATPLSDKHGELPKDCIEKHFVDGDLGGTAEQEISARFAVDNPDCDLPACPATDLPCTFKRDIACTVVID